MQGLCVPRLLNGVPFRLRKRSLSCDLNACLTLLVVREPHLKALFVENTWCEGGRPLRRCGASTFSAGGGLLRKEPGAASELGLRAGPAHHPQRTGR